MSDPIRHECGIAVVRLLKPLAYYHDKYKSALHGLDILHALMSKQRNRGQDGFGMGCCKLNMPPGLPYMSRLRSAKSVESLGEFFAEQMKEFGRLARRKNGEREDEAKQLKDAKTVSKSDWVKYENDPEAIKRDYEMAGEIYFGHLRYGTSGSFGKASLHPYLRRSNWPTRSLMVMGNFNITNTRELNDLMMVRGQHPVFGTDTQTVLEEIGYHLDEDHTEIYRRLRDQGVDGRVIPHIICDQLHVTDIVRKSAEHWDGGYTIAGAVGNGDTFVLRDPNGIRPCFYFCNDELIAFASERAALRTVFELEEDQTQELAPAHVAVIKADGTFKIEPYTEPREPRPCSFEKIYFSRGNDASVYQARKRLGEMLVPQALEAIGGELDNTVLSFIPNTAETAYYGFTDGLRKHRRTEVRASLMEMWASGKLDPEKLDELVMRNWPRAEKIAHKDVKMRTFISQEEGRAQLASQVYDITYGVVTPEDNLVVLDDSIVRGTTLRKSILRILARTNPKRIIIVSTSPQIRYPDCYGIDMAELGKFIAFEAAIRLLGHAGLRHVEKETYDRCKAELLKPAKEQVNAVKAIYEPFTDEQISAEIAELVRPTDITWKGELRIIFQTIDNLHKAISPECGDWYFSGNYPTPGGTAVVNEAYVRYCDKKPGRVTDTLL
jgi:amidophosphoribosyltransferase